MDNENEKRYLMMAATLAQSRGGDCVSTRFPARQEDAALEWQCQQQHRWFATYTAISQGRWCLLCSSQNL